MYRFLIHMESSLPSYTDTTYIYNKLQLRIISILECLDVDTFLISNNLKILFANSSYMTNSGFRIEDVIGNYCWQAVCHKPIQNNAPPETCPIKILLSSRRPLVKTEKFLDQNGNERLVHVATALFRIKDSQESYIYIVLPVHDPHNSEIESQYALKKCQKVLDLISQVIHQEDQIQRMDAEITQIQETLQVKLSQYDFLYKNLVERELKMAELKKQITELQTHANK
jgi:hypothetical protein